MGYYIGYLVYISMVTLWCLIRKVNSVYGTELISNDTIKFNMQDIELTGITFHLHRETAGLKLTY